jgi:S-formylglutathione hydrolase
MGTIEKISEQKSFGGLQGYYRHDSSACRGPMRFSVYQPPQAKVGPVPVVYYLSGLTCTEDNFTIKGGAQRIASELGLMVVAPDTSPRNTGIPGEAADWQFGAGAGFYLDATEAPWSKFFNMYTYCSSELPALIAENFPIDAARQSIFGHSMGGHGALTIALKRPEQYKSVSAFAPIVAPMQVRWGETAFRRYLGADRETWKQYDATELVQRKQFPGTILIDQGDADNFLNDTLRPEIFEAACQKVGQSLNLRMQRGYDHSYWFISTFMEDHLRHHAAALHI